MIVIGDRTDKPEIGELDIMGLEDAVRIAETGEMNGFISGHAAFAAWDEQVLSDHGTTQVMAENLKANFEVHNCTVGNVAESRAWAARYLWDIMEERHPEGETAEALDAATSAYDDIHSLMWEAWNVLGGNGNPDAYIKFADRKNREKLSQIIEKAMSKDIEAVKNIKKALKLLKGA